MLIILSSYQSVMMMMMMMMMMMLAVGLKCRPECVVMFCINERNVYTNRSPYEICLNFQRFA